MKLNDYKPKVAGVDQQVFNGMFMNYVNHLDNAGDNTSEPSPSERPYSQ
jgi:hypothetical protein